MGRCRGVDSGQCASSTALANKTFLCESASYLLQAPRSQASTAGSEDLPPRLRWQVWNCHRVYGPLRLTELLRRWTVLAAAGLRQAILDSPVYSLFFLSLPPRSRPPSLSLSRSHPRQGSNCPPQPPVPVSSISRPCKGCPLPCTSRSRHLSPLHLPPLLSLILSPPTPDSHVYPLSPSLGAFLSLSPSIPLCSPVPPSRSPSRCRLPLKLSIAL